jgi:hypothetical protein
MGQSEREQLSRGLIAQPSVGACHQTGFDAKGGGGRRLGRADQELAIKKAGIRVIERHFEDEEWGMEDGRGRVDYGGWTMEKQDKRDLSI